MLFVDWAATVRKGGLAERFEPATSMNAAVAEGNLTVVLGFAFRAFGVVWLALANLVDRVAERVVAMGRFDGGWANQRDQDAALVWSALGDGAEVIAWGAEAVVRQVEASR